MWKHLLSGAIDCFAQLPSLYRVCAGRFGSLPWAADPNIDCTAPQVSALSAYTEWNGTLKWTNLRHLRPCIWRASIVHANCPSSPPPLTCHVTWRDLQRAQIRTLKHSITSTYKINQNLSIQIYYTIITECLTRAEWDKSRRKSGL